MFARVVRMICWSAERAALWTEFEGVSCNFVRVATDVELLPCCGLGAVFTPVAWECTLTPGLLPAFRSAIFMEAGWAFALALGVVLPEFFGCGFAFNITRALALGLSFGFCFGLGFGFWFGLGFAFSFGCGFGFCFGFGFGFGFSFGFGFGFSLGFGFGFCFGLTFGLPLDLGTSGLTCLSSALHEGGELATPRVASAE